MTDTEFALIWALSFGLYFVIYTFWIPLKTQKRIETWLLSDESDDTLVEALDVIVREIRKTTLQDFEEFMLPRARDSFKNFWNGAMGNAVKEIGKTEEGSKLHMISSMAESLKDESWYVQALASKFLPALEKASKSEPLAKMSKELGMGLRK